MKFDYGYQLEFVKRLSFEIHDWAISWNGMRLSEVISWTFARELSSNFNVVISWFFGVIKWNFNRTIIWNFQWGYQMQFCVGLSVKIFMKLSVIFFGVLSDEMECDHQLKFIFGVTTSNFDRVINSRKITILLWSYQLEFLKGVIC